MTGVNTILPKPNTATMFWFSYLIIALILIGLLYAYNSEMYLTQVLIITNLVIFIIVVAGGMLNPNFINTIYDDLAGRAIYISSPFFLLLRGHTFLTLMFLHAGLMHIVGNILVLFFIGMPLEDRVGKKWTFIFYLISGLIATLGQYLFNWIQVLFGTTGVEILWIRNLGASGAVFGIMGALVFLYPKDKITMIIPPLLLPEVRVDVSVVAFIAIQTGISIFAGSGNIAHAAHFTGFAAGIVIAAYAKKRGVIERRKGPIRDYSKLERLIATKDQEEIYQKIMESDEKEVKEAWSEQLIKESNCPKCGRSLKGDKCECGFSVWED